jgi:hypothetical protein
LDDNVERLSRAIREILVKDGSYDPSIEFIEKCIDQEPLTSVLSNTARYELIQIIINDIKALRLSFAVNMAENGALDYITGKYDPSIEWDFVPSLKTPSISRFFLKTIKNKYVICVIFCLTST